MSPVPARQPTGGALLRRVRDPAGPDLRKLRDSPVTHGDQQMTGRGTTTGSSCSEQRAGNTAHLGGALRRLALPKLFNLRTDPYEGADVASNTEYDWIIDYAFTLVPAQAFVAQFLTTFKDDPQRQKAATFNRPVPDLGREDAIEVVEPARRPADDPAPGPASGLF